jgi:hypothetical protein
MAADLHIHVFAEGELTEADFRNFFSNTLGSKWFNPRTIALSREIEDRDRVTDTESVWVGEVSWLKAALFEDDETFIPNPVAQVNEIIGENLPIVDDALIEKIHLAVGVPNNTSYDVTGEHEVIAFLEKHRGKRAFTVSW